MNLNQTKLIGLTMELDLKARDFNLLCNKLDKLKEKGIDPNDERLLEVKELFQKNHDDIVKINEELRELKKTEELIEKQKREIYNPENIFNKTDNLVKIKQEKETNLAVFQTKKSSFSRIVEKIKNVFNNMFNIK